MNVNTILVSALRTNAVQNVVLIMIVMTANSVTVLKTATRLQVVRTDLNRVPLMRFAMNRLTKNKNMLEDFSNGF